jgi:predicted aspartyl protease
VRLKHLAFFLIVVIFAGKLCAANPSSSPESAFVDLSIFFSNDSTRDFKTLIIPIRRVQNLIVIEARINNVVGNFILDTGCPLLVLNKTYFRKGWELDDKTEASATSASAAPITRTDVNNLNIRELYFEKLSAELSDLGHIENQRGIKILGLLGVSLFTTFEMVIDMHKGVLYLHRLNEHGDVPEGEQVVHTSPLLKVPFELYKNIITLEVMIANKKLSFCLDTGAETNTLSNMLPGKILQAFTVSRRMVLLGTGGSQSEVLLGTLSEFSVGGRSFKNMHAAITRLENLGNAYGRSIDGILGNNFLVKGIITINFVTRELAMYAYDVEKPEEKQ